MNQESQGHWALVAILATAAVLALRCIGDSALGWPDADRILMDGVFVRDFVASFDWFRPFESASRYFAQYPALSIGYRVPGYPLLIGLFQLLLGISMWSARLAEIALWLVALYCWYGMIRRLWGVGVAATATLLLATTPFVVQWAWVTMTELPLLSLTIIAVSLWHRYLETDRPSLAIYSCLAIAAAAWTKQTAIFLLVWFFLEALLSRRGALLKRREILLAIVLGAILLAPIAALTLSFDEHNLAQSVGTGRIESDPRLELGHMATGARLLATRQLSAAVLLLAIGGLVTSAVRRDRKALFFAVGIIAIYLFFASLVAQNARYTIVWIPLFTLFAALGLESAHEKLPRWRWLMPLALGLLVSWQIVQTYRMPLNRATGYDEAAQYVLDHSRFPIVMFDGYNNGYFTYFMRALDPERRMWVLRGDKMLSSSTLVATNSLTIYAEDEEDIEEILQRFGVEFVVVESEDLNNLEIHRLLRRFLEKGPFDLELEIPIEGDRRFLAGQRLLLYRYRKAAAAQVESIVIPVPLVGRSIEAPWPSDVRSPESTPR